jgi:hypothetical protein
MPLGTRLQASGLQLKSSFEHLVGMPELSWFLCAPFQISKRAAGWTAEFSRSGVELCKITNAV